MRTFFIFFFFVSLLKVGFSQEQSEKLILDSILTEADLLYYYEKAVWNSTDLLFEINKLKKNYGGYVVSHNEDVIKVTYFDKKQKECIARYEYQTDNFSKPFQVTLTSSNLTKTEKELMKIKITIVEQLSDKRYNVTFPEGFDPNLILIKTDDDYKLYIIMGSKESGVIPFGNDFLFKANSKGIITDWIKFHSRIIPADCYGPNGEVVTMSMHSHLKTIPYITPTDICTFRLYAPLCRFEEFRVYSPALKKTFSYILESNTIEIVE